MFLFIRSAALAGVTARSDQRAGERLNVALNRPSMLDSHFVRQWLETINIDLVDIFDGMPEGQLRDSVREILLGRPA